MFRSLKFESHIPEHKKTTFFDIEGIYTEDWENTDVLGKLINKREAKLRSDDFFLIDSQETSSSNYFPYSNTFGDSPFEVKLAKGKVFFVHGTSSNSKRWNLKIIASIMKLANGTSYDSNFNWNAPLSNNKKDRGIAAQNLAKYVLAGHVNEIEIVLVGHSHGGNVAIQAADIIYRMSGQKVNIITIATPAYNGNLDVENPKNHKGINDHIALWNDIDGVSGGLAGDDYYTNSDKTKNVEVNVDQYYKREVTRRDRWGNETKDMVESPIAAHSFDVEHPETIDKAIQVQKIKLIPVK